MSTSNVSNFKSVIGPDHKERQEIVNTSLQKLKESGFKITKKRREIIELFVADVNYLRAKDIHDQLAVKYPTMSYNTTYRNLYDFTEIGILETTELNNEQLFKISCTSIEPEHHHHHHHFICRNCGLTIPIASCPMPDVTDDLKGVVIESHRFEVFGLCANCA